ncbi:MAG: FAD:protein FMN transferase [Gammaproteobacteria bacterium]
MYLLTEKLVRQLALWIGCLVLVSCGVEQEKHPLLTLTGFTMGTSYNVKINEPHLNIDAGRIKSDIDSTLEKINMQMSTYRKDSELSHINQSHNTDWISISDKLFTVIHMASVISKLSEGAFDITSGPIVNLWGFGPGSRPEEIPSEEMINIALNKVGYQFLHVRETPSALKKDKGDMYIDLSGIAKGFAVDEVADYLDELAIQDYMVEIGGEVKAKGLNSNGVPWKIGVEKPLADKRLVQEIIKLDNIAMATSGDYRNYFEHDGIRYSHTIDPKAGRPITHNLVSVTVLHDSAMFADAMATALLVMGLEPGMLLAQQNNLAVLFIIKGKDGFVERATDVFFEYSVN